MPKEIILMSSKTRFNVLWCRHLETFLKNVSRVLSNAKKKTFFSLKTRKKQRCMMISYLNYYLLNLQIFSYTFFLTCWIY